MSLRVVETGVASISCWKEAADRFQSPKCYSVDEDYDVAAGV